MKLKNSDKNRQMAEEDEEPCGGKGELERPTDREGGEEGGGIPGVTLRQGAEAEAQTPPPPPLHFQEIVASYVT